MLILNFFLIIFSKLFHYKSTCLGLVGRVNYDTMKMVMTMIISQYFVGFVFFSFLGWIYECTYCMLNTGTWENRGFLFGPYCPIYGIGVMSAFFIFHSGVLPTSGDTNPIEIFLVCMIGSAIIEYLTSYILEKKYHARWWDYSNVPLNIHGRIALPISIAFGLAGVVIVRYVLPLFKGFGTSEPSLWMELLSLALMAVVATDFGMTLATLSSIVDKITDVEEQFGDRVQWAYDRASESKDELQIQLDNYAEYVKMKVSQAAGSLGGKEINILHRMRYTKDEVEYTAHKMENLGKMLRKKKKEEKKQESD